MQFDPPLQPAILLKRYKRFLADVVTPDGRELTLHCPNTGAMTGCAARATPSGIPPRTMRSANMPTRELTETQQGAVICVNTLRANSLAKEAISAGIIPELSGYNQLKSEVKYGEENSRIDIMLQADDRQNCYIEVKSVTLAEKEYGYFPDAVTTRGQKHLRELMAVAANGDRAVILFAVLHSAIDRFLPRIILMPDNAQLLTEAQDKGWKFSPWKAELSTTRMTLNKPIAVVLNPGK